MGCWGAKLYDDDMALDIKASVQLLSKTPYEGCYIAKLLLEMYEVTENSEEETLFWLVIADQFERRGFICQHVTKKALKIIEEGLDLERFSKEESPFNVYMYRKKVLEELASRLITPRSPRKLPSVLKRPTLELDVGEIYTFPTMNGIAHRPSRNLLQGEFKPDGWGALIVLAHGYAFDWFAWCGLASLSVNPDKRPTLNDALNAQLIFHLQTEGAVRCIPKKKEITMMGLERLGKVELDPEKVLPYLSKWSLNKSLMCSWGVAYAGYSSTINSLPRGPILSSLLAF